MVDLTVAPFFLNEEDITWVQETIEEMTDEEKLGQLFCVEGSFFTLDELIEKNVGGVLYRPEPASEIRATYTEIQSRAKIPFLLAANTEYGGIGVTTDGTAFAKPMLVGATDHEEQAYRLGLVACRETAAVGGNWSFAPVTDIDNNWRNPIVNVRSFGNDPDRVLAMCKGFLRGAKEAGVAVSVKHFPGDGMDGRDQHLHLTVNSLSADDWMATYGRNYRELIRDGAETVMVGHIAQPALVKKINPNASERSQYMPATLSPELLQGVLRQELGFNGLISTDATSMLGFFTGMKRCDAVPAAIMAGCDMFLFNASFEEDFSYMKEAYDTGVLTKERLQEALERILGLKAALGLHRKQKENTLIPTEDALKVLHCEQYQQWAQQCADEGVTLVKDTADILPLTPEKYPRIALLSMENTGRAGDIGGCSQMLKEQLESEGFEVYEPGMEELSLLWAGTPPTIASLKDKYDLILYCFNLQPVSNQTTIRLNWKEYTNCTMPWMNEEIPTMAVSFAYPYHLYDIPQVHTLVNAYLFSEFTMHTVVNALTGKQPFLGTSPVDAFCGLPEAHF
ncbi:MAG TPA: beta-hexosaminidase [Lachnospiraceae bacterium]|nr:beta-hexosaminidase [Lachnospiraceae bacterium]